MYRALGVLEVSVSPLFRKSREPSAPLRDALFRDGLIPPAASLDQANHVAGVVVEVGLEGGLDLLAAYDDHTARYYNYSGAGVVWEHPDASLDAAIDALLARGQVICQQIGPWEGERPGPPPRGDMRISLLTPLGLHFGQAPHEVLARDPLAGPLVAAATSLMQQLIAKSR